MRIILTVDDEAIHYENNRSDPYFKWLKNKGIPDTLENYLEWGIALLVWGEPVKILEIQVE